MEKHAIIVFAKAPVCGQVKTRLASHLSPEQRLNVHCAFVQDTLNIVGKLQLPSLDKFISFTKDYFDETAQARKLEVPPCFSILTQSDGNLGDKLKDAFLRMFAEGYGKVVIIGSDSPTLPGDFILDAFAKLETHEIVVGPSHDGGYYLIGCARYLPEVFEEIAWGTDRVFQATMRRIRKFRLSLALLPPWYDVDTLDDLNLLLKEIEHPELKRHFEMPRHTMAVLAALSESLKSPSF